MTPTAIPLPGETSGFVRERTGYASFGEATPTSALPKGYIGERPDPETGLLYLNARYVIGHAGFDTARISLGNELVARIILVRPCAKIGILGRKAVAVPNSVGRRFAFLPELVEPLI